ncbi:MAG: SDR family NAD(P)-dependent oxidoreductase [bacterium]
MPGIKDFENKVVVITGAGSGIGRATALAFAREKAILVLVDKELKRLEMVQSEAESSGVKPFIKQVDVSNKEEVKMLAQFVINELGRVDILHNNAGVSVGGRIEDIPIEDWEWLFGINLWGVIYGVHYFLPYMIKQRSGHIVNTSSILGLAATPATGTYSTAKFAIVGFGEALRPEVNRYNIGVTTVCPGLINTRIVADGRIKTDDNSKSRRENVIAYFKNHGKPPESVAEAILKAIRKNKAIVLVGLDAHIIWYIKRLSPDLYNMLLNLAARHLV